MNMKKAALMLSIMLITILSASCFYVITGEADSDLLTINNNNTDYEKVYVKDDENAPYGETGHKYYIRYTGAISGRNVVDLDDTDVKDKNGNSVGGCGVTKNADGTIEIFGQEITSTYKMFSYRSGAKYNTEVSRVFISASIAIENDGIAANTFEGYNDNEIDCIYRTGDITKERKLANGTKILAKTRNARGSGIVADYDKTGKISNTDYPNVITYVCLDDKNINRDGIIGDYSNAYNGIVNNVFVSNKVSNWRSLFGISGDSTSITNTENSNDQIKYVLLDDGSVWTDTQDLSLLFTNQIHFQMTNHFQLPNNKYVTNLSYTFYQCMAIEELPSNFTIPSYVENMNYTFDSMRNLKSFPENFYIPDSVTTMKYTFSSLYKLESFPNDFVIPNSVKQMEGTFASMYVLKGIITIPKEVENVDLLFTYTGKDQTSKLYGYNTPVVMKYYSSNKKASDYTNNVLTTSQSGYVTKVPITNQSDWAKVTDNTNGTNSDDNGTNKYYFHYTGTTTTVDLDDETIYPKTSDGYPSIKSTRVYSTYKMFAKNDSNDHNENLYRVFIPGSIAITTDGIASNTFSGCNQVIDCVYHTTNITNKSRGQGITSDYDKTGKIDLAVSPNVTTYVYLGKENITDRTELDTHQLALINSYAGYVKNVYVSSDVKKLDYLFAYTTFASFVSPLDSFYFSEHIDNATAINYVLFDENNTATSMLRTFYGQIGREFFTSHIKLPINVTDFGDLFMGCVYMASVPEGFSIPNTSSDITIHNMFCDCRSLVIISQSLLDSLMYNTNITDVSALFARCVRLNSYTAIPLNVTNMASCFSDAGIYASQPLFAGCPIVMYYYGACNVAEGFSENIYPSGKVFKHNLGTYVSPQSNDSFTNPIVTTQESTDNLMVIDYTDDVNVVVNKVNSNTNQMIEVTTEPVTITVNKKTVDEVVEETQTNSEATKNVNGESDVNQEENVGEE